MNLELIHSGYLPINVNFADRRRHDDAFDAYCRVGSADGMIHLIGGMSRSGWGRSWKSWYTGNDRLEIEIGLAYGQICGQGEALR